MSITIHIQSVSVAQLVVNESATEILPLLHEIIARQQAEKETDLATNEEVTTLLGQINDATTNLGNSLTEIAADVDALLATPDVPDSVIAGLNDIKAKIDPLATQAAGIASAYPVVEPVPPPAPDEPLPTPGDEPLPDEPPVEPPVEPTPPNP